MHGGAEQNTGQPWTPAYRGMDRTQPIPPCTFTPEDLTQLYRTIQGKNNELLETFVARTRGRAAIARRARRSAMILRHAMPQRT